MNWTGGRLQRHSKANANAQLKAQRDYFARARLHRSAKPTVSTPQHIAIAATDQLEKQPDRSRYHFAHNSAIDYNREQQRHKLSQPTKKNGSETLKKSTQSRKVDPSISESTASSRIKTLEDVKKSLLRQSDWMGLAPARPFKIGFKPAISSGHIGRRRKVTKVDRHRQNYGLGEGKVEHELIKPFDQVQDRIRAQVTQSEDVSIRIGSDIHQSQALNSNKLSEKPSSAKPETSSVDPMLLDIVEAHAPLRAGNDSAQYYLREDTVDNGVAASLQQNQESIDGQALIPLERALDFTNFDQVKVWSSSAKNSALTSSVASKNDLRTMEADRSRTRQHASSSIVEGRPLNGRRLFSTGGNSDLDASRNNEPSHFNRISNVIECITTGPEISDRHHIRDKFDEKQYPTRINIHGDFHTTNQGGTSAKRVSHRASIKNPSSSHDQRPLYTIERQAQLEISSIQETNQEDRLTALELASSMPSRDSAPGIRPSRKVNGPATSLPQQKTKDHPRDSRDTILRHTSAVPARLRRQGDGNETWMRDVLRTEFDKPHQTFSFAKAPTRRNTHGMPSQHELYGQQRQEASSSKHSDFSLPGTIRTTANAVLYTRQDPSLIRRDNPFLPSETDFLTQMSPMTEYLDEYYADTSMYNNPSLTACASAKRSASEAFGDTSYDDHDNNDPSENEMVQFRRTTRHRVPLDAVDQAPLHTTVHSNEATLFHVQEPETFKPVWRRGKAASPLKASKTGHDVSSNRSLHTPPRQAARFPLYYTLLKEPPDPHRTIGRAKPPGQTPYIATSDSQSQFSSPTNTSQYRVPLGSRQVSKNADVRFDNVQSVEEHAPGANMFTSSATFGTLASLRHGAGLPTSSSSAVSNHRGVHPIAKIHAGGHGAFVLERPERSAALYSCLSRTTPQFRFPAPVPLH